MTPPTAKLMIKTNCPYGISLNPSVQCYEAPNNESFVQAYCYFLHKLMTDSTMEATFPDLVLYPEYSAGKRVTGKKSSIIPRLHYHGYTSIEPFRYYTQTCSAMNKWLLHTISEKPDIDYCIKNREIMETFCNKYHLPYEITWKSLKNKKVKGLIKTWYKRAMALNNMTSDQFYYQSDSSEASEG